MGVGGEWVKALVTDLCIENHNVKSEDISLVNFYFSFHGNFFTFLAGGEGKFFAYYGSFHLFAPFPHSARLPLVEIYLVK